MVCLLKWLQIIHAHALINYLCTNILSSLIQIGSQPHMVCIVWCVMGDPILLLYVLKKYWFQLPEDGEIIH